MTEAPHAFRSVLEVLSRHEVRFIVIGGLAGALHGSTVVTHDVDVCYARDAANLERLAAALRALGARLRNASASVPFVLDARTLAMGDHFTFDSFAGPIDILGTPAGARGGFDELDRDAIDVDLGGLVVRVVALDALIRMKLAAGREKDRLMVEELGALREEIERKRREG